MGYNKHRDPYWKGIYTAADKVRNDREARGIGEESRRTKLENTVRCPNCDGSGQSGSSKCYACYGSGRVPFGTTQQQAMDRHNATAYSQSYSKWQKANRW